MSQETEIDGRRDGLALVRPSRILGPYEEWEARPLGRPDLPEVVCARRPHPQRADKEALCRRLEQASGRAQHVEHHLITQCFGILEGEAGVVVQLLEWLPATDLDAVLRANDLGALAPPAAVWIARQVLEAVGHAHGLGVLHGALSPTHVLIDPTGAVKVDFGLSAPPAADHLTTDYIDLRYVGDDASPARPRPQTDVYAVATMLTELLVGAPQDPSANRPPLREAAPQLPDRLTQTITAARSSAGILAHDFSAALDQVFYVDFAAQDDRDGQTAVAGRLALMRSTGQAVATEAPTLLMGGHFTRALKARLLPVEPQDFSADDNLSPSDGWSLPGPDGPTVATVSANPTPDLSVSGPPPPSERLTEPLGGPAPALASRFSPPPSLSPMPSVHPVRPARPPLLLWTLFGFTVTFSVILMWRWMQSSLG